MAKGRARRGRASENVTCLAAATFVNYVTESENYSPWWFFFFFTSPDTGPIFHAFLRARVSPVRRFKTDRRRHWLTAQFIPPSDSFSIPLFTPRPVNSYETCGGRPDEKVEKRVQVARIYTRGNRKYLKRFVFLGRGGKERRPPSPRLS